MCPQTASRSGGGEELAIFMKRTRGSKCLPGRKPAWDGGGEGKDSEEDEHGTALRF